MAATRNGVRGAVAAREVSVVMGIHLSRNVHVGRWRLRAVVIRTLSM